MLNPDYKMTDQSFRFSDGIGAAAYATLETEQLISHTRTVIADTFNSMGF